MIDAYANQLVTWKKKTGTNDYNEPSYAADATIKARLEYHRKMVRNAQAQEIISEARIYTRTAISPDDVIVTSDGREWTIITVASQPALDGSIVFYEGSL